LNVNSDYSNSECNGREHRGQADSAKADDDNSVIRPWPGGVKECATTGEHRAPKQGRNRGRNVGVDAYD
jgi:hypothetical protein